MKKGFVFVVMGIGVKLEADKKSPEQCVEQLAQVLENVKEHQDEARMVRLYGTLEGAMQDANESNAWAFRRASEGLRGDNGGKDYIYYVEMKEVF